MTHTWPCLAYRRRRVDYRKRLEAFRETKTQLDAFVKEVFGDEQPKKREMLS